jgi:hypothetical protein
MSTQDNQVVLMPVGFCFAAMDGSFRWCGDSASGRSKTRREPAAAMVGPAPGSRYGPRAQERVLPCGPCVQAGLWFKTLVWLAF